MGKNSSSTDYTLAFDSIELTPVGGWYEAIGTLSIRVLHELTPVSGISLQGRASMQLARAHCFGQDEGAKLRHRGMLLRYTKVRSRRTSPRLSGIVGATAWNN